MGYRRPVYSGLLGRLMTDEEQEAQEKYLAEKSAEVSAKAHEDEKRVK